MQEIKPNQTGTINKNREDNNSAGGRQVSDGLKNESNVFGEVPLSSPIPVNLPASPRNISPSRELYYMSARSLSKSHAPAMGSFLAQRKTSPSVHDSNSLEEPLLSSVVLSQSAPASTTKSMLSMLSATMFFLGCFNFLPSENNRDGIAAEKPNQGGIALKVGRTLLQLSEGGGNSGIGTFLGWSMAAIYLGGRLPQIILNIRRGTIEGLNPLMFLFALTGNATYVGSILVSSLDWSKIKPNLPWLVDAGGCVLLDAFILTQFIHFHSRTPEDQENKDGNFNAA
ncbi:putative vacuolar amino acid transporter YPQ1 [Vitis vinifera]|uniref:Putative vacuolar amino acid transporter YPQ1 n=1 Tax=Vitis vinifera TaxID=29760 RepID=A0A438FNU8_VITVI|nr:putative vacuolar amino acid transporter YPQ1 [Vitis vinifera]